ncbi:MAG: hypothetical protein QOJ79_828 [Actinomycetota bacterium]|jgi:hypothetical protein|nr:hypothetical protein [Actinomycetota bacterium]
MSRALPLLLAATIAAGVTGAALVPAKDDASHVVAMADTGPVQVSPIDWTTAGRTVGHEVAMKTTAEARAAKAAADQRAREARALEAKRRASRARRVAAVSYGSPRAIARAMLADRGWSDQWGCLDSLWSRESGWRVYASNPSGAYGIPQALPGSKMASAGSDWRTNPATQIRWGLGYIASAYGSPCAAWHHSESHGWY